MKSFIWELFTKTSDNEATCSICKKKLKYYGSTTNLKKHMMRIHPIQYNKAISNEPEMTEGMAKVMEVIENAETEVFSNASTSTSTTNQNWNTQDKINVSANVEHPPSKKKKQLKLFGCSSTEISPHQKEEMDNSLLEMIVLDFQPFSFIENAGFKNFVRKLNPLYQIPSRKYLTNVLLNNKYIEVSLKSKKTLSEVEYVSVTTDIWTSDSNKSYISVTCHFVNKNLLISQVLSTDEIVGPHTAENIGNILNKVFGDWEINDKVVTVVSDNGSNIKCAINEFLKKHHHPCVAHTLNLCVNDSLKANEALMTILKKCRNLVTHFKHSVLATEKLKNVQEQMGFPVLKVKQDVPTRWNSTLIMLERLLEIKNSLSVTLSNLPKAPPSLDASEWAIVWDCVPLLKPIEILTSVLSAEKYPTISMIIPLTRGLQHTLKSINNNTEVGNFLKNSLLEVIGRRIAPLESNKIVAKATFLDPRFKNISFGLEENAKNAESWVIDEIKQIIQQNSNTQTDANPNVETAGTVSVDSSKDIWAYLDQKINKKKSVITPSITAQLMVRQYLQMPYLDRSKCPLTFWEEHKNTLPEMYQIAVKYLCIPGTSVPSERVFSKAGQLTNIRRNRLLPKNLNKIIFLNSFFQ